MKLSARQARRLRIMAQRLAPSTNEVPQPPNQLLQAIIGVQAQEYPAGMLSMRARSPGLTAAGVDRARLVDRTIAWSWAMRGTLHLVAADDLPWLLRLLGPGLERAGQRRLRQLGWDETLLSSGFKLLEKHAATQGGVTRAEVTRLLEQAHLPFEGQAPIHLLYHAAIKGMICKGPDRDGESAYVPNSSWFASSVSISREEALIKLARGYIAAYGPAQKEDFAAWSGLKSQDTAAAWRALQDDLAPIDIEDQPAWILQAHMGWLDFPETGPIVNLLPRYDTYLLGYGDRGLAVAPQFARRVHPGGGIIHAVLLVDGQAAGTWSSTLKRGRLEISIQPFEALERRHDPHIDAEIADIGHFLGKETMRAQNGLM